MRFWPAWPSRSSSLPNALTENGQVGSRNISKTRGPFPHTSDQPAMNSAFDRSSFTWSIRDDSPGSDVACRKTRPAQIRRQRHRLQHPTGVAPKVLARSFVPAISQMSPYRSSCRVIPLRKRGTVSRASVRALHPTGRDRDRFRLRSPSAAGQYASPHRIRRCAHNVGAQSEMPRFVGDRIRKSARRVVFVPIERSEFHPEQQAPPADVACLQER